MVEGVHPTFRRLAEGREPGRFLAPPRPTRLPPTRVRTRARGVERDSVRHGAPLARRGGWRPRRYSQKKTTHSFRTGSRACILSRDAHSQS